MISLKNSKFAPEILPALITQRALTVAEKKKMRRSHFIIIPGLLIPAFIIYVLYKVESLPTAARIGGVVIAVAAVLIIWRKQSQLEKDLKQDINVVKGKIVRKFKTGNRISKGGGTSVSTSGSKHKSISYYLLIGGKRYRVLKKTYNKAIEGAYMEMVHLPKSGYVASIKKIDKPAELEG